MCVRRCVRARVRVCVCVCNNENEKKMNRRKRASFLGSRLNKQVGKALSTRKVPALPAGLLTLVYAYGKTCGECQQECLRKVSLRCAAC